MGEGEVYLSSDDDSDCYDLESSILILVVRL